MPAKTSNIPKFCAYPIFTVREGEPIPGARDLVNYIRKQLFKEHAKKKMFAMLNKKNAEYEAEYPSIQCTRQVVSKLRNYGMLPDQPLVRGMVHGRYVTEAHFILKPSKRGSEWLMLYLNKKA